MRGPAKHSTLLIDILEQGYQLKTWHGPNLRQSLRGVPAKMAAWRPGVGRHNIWEIAVHAAYWKYTARRRLLGEKRGVFALKGSNFFPRPEEFSEKAWRADLALLEAEHRKLRVAVAEVLGVKMGQAQERLIFGVAFHDVYHAGQIRLLRRLYADKKSGGVK